ncbi:hypothetical protein [Streptomyces lavendofoliae]|uniref:Secreted protein n=1 Tax=Streptomyces lavendofoliae TaxID=67314 RepID=A0A918M3K8_9ACTN|nr:hypothetical protein [Streptomyces lavendofoliae]GGU29880.1 hypothetical protein GCM10010274_16110 [Streptomyces lavendofoliae]
MRLLTPRRVAVTALCAALTLGTAGPALAHATHQATATQQAKAPEDFSDILGSVGGVLDAVLGTVSGTSTTQTLPAAETNQQMKDLTAAIEALREAMAEANTKTSTGTAGTVPASSGTTDGTGGASWTEVDDTTPDAAGTPTPDIADAPDAAGSADATDTADTNLDKALASMDKAIDELVEAAVKGQAGTSASQIHAATQSLMDAIMRDVARMTGTQATGTNTLPATSDPATSAPATTLPATTALPAAAAPRAPVTGR